MRTLLLPALVLALALAACIDFQEAQNGFCRQRPGECPPAEGADGGASDGGVPDGGVGDGGGAEDGGGDAGSIDGGPATPSAQGAWLDLAGGPFTLEQGFGGLAVSGDGHTTLVGHFRGVSDFGAGGVTSDVGQGLQPVVARYDATGALVWLRQFGTAGSEVGVAAGADQSGHSYLVGNFNGGAVVSPDGGAMPATGAAVLRLRPDGGLASAVRITGGSNTAGYMLSASRAVVDSSGRAVVAGRYTGSSIIVSATCANSHGQYAYGGPFSVGLFPDGGCAYSAVLCDGVAAPADVAIDDVTGEMLVLIDNGHADCTVGNAYTRAGVPANTLWLVVFRADGTFESANPLFLPGGQPARLASHGGTAWLATTFTGALQLGDAGYASAGGTDLVMVKINTSAAGVYPKSERIFPNPGDATVRSLRFTTDGRLWLGGEFTLEGPAFGGLTLDAGAGGAASLFLAQLGTTGGLSQLSAHRLGTTGSAALLGLALTPDGGVLVGGELLGTVDFGTDAGALVAPTTTGTQNPLPPSLFFGRPALP